MLGICLTVGLVIAGQAQTPEKDAKTRPWAVIAKRHAMAAKVYARDDPDHPFAPLKEPGGALTISFFQACVRQTLIGTCHRVGLIPRRSTGRLAAGFLAPELERATLACGPKSTDPNIAGPRTTTSPFIPESPRRVGGLNW